MTTTPQSGNDRVLNHTHQWVAPERWHQHDIAELFRDVTANRYTRSGPMTPADSIGMAAHLCSDEMKATVAMVLEDESHNAYGWVAVGLNPDGRAELGGLIDSKALGLWPASRLGRLGVQRIMEAARAKWPGVTVCAVVNKRNTFAKRMLRRSSTMLITYTDGVRQ